MNFSDTLPTLSIFKAITQSARDLNVEAYLVGGYVRDLILKRTSNDIDVVCVGSGIALAEKVAGYCAGHVDVGVFKNFGTAQIKTDGLEVEFVGARRESYQRDSRKPIVEDGTLEDDQNRRDFTINAMSIALNEVNFGQLIDPFDGVGDLRRRIIKTPLAPEATFSDDPLRMMRAVRFAAQLNFDIEPDTFEGIVRMKDRIGIVSGERIAEELNKIVLSPTPSYGFKLLHQCGLLQIVFPEFVELLGAQTQDGKGHKDNFYHTLQVLDNISKHTDDLWLRWAAILHDIAKPATKRFDPKVGWTFHGHEDLGARMTPNIFKKLKLPMNEKMRFVQKLVRLHLRPIALTKETVTDSALRRLLYETGPDLEALMTLCRADITSKNSEKVKRYLQNFDHVERKLYDLEARDQIRNFQPVVTGEHIMAAFGLQPSAEVGVIKTNIREAILDGIIANEYHAARAFMLVEGQKLGLTPIENHS